MGMKLREYAWNGSHWKDTGDYFEFDPNPSGVTKEVKTEWRVRHTGLYATWPRCKYRYRRTVTFTLKGACSGEKRRELEFYSMRNSKFKIDTSSWTGLQTPEYYNQKDVYNPFDYPWEGVNHPNQTIYVMFQEFNTEIAEGKVDWFTYTIKLQVINNANIIEA